MKALRTQNLLKDNNLGFLGFEKWSGNSPSLIAFENVGSILNYEVKKKDAV